MTPQTPQLIDDGFLDEAEPRRYGRPSLLARLLGWLRKVWR